MNITLNDASVSVFEGISIEGLLSEKQLLERKGIAVAVNQTVIPKENWSTHVIQENDQIIIITATQGG